MKVCGSDLSCGSKDQVCGCWRDVAMFLPKLLFVNEENNIKGTYLPDTCLVKAASSTVNGLGRCLRTVRWMGGSGPLDLLDL